jgi:hypothetical protein
MHATKLRSTVLLRLPYSILPLVDRKLHTGSITLMARGRAAKTGYLLPPANVVELDAVKQVLASTGLHAR